MNRLRSLLRGNVMRADLTPQQVERINAALLTAVAAIESEMHIQPTQQEKNRCPATVLIITVEALSDRQGNPVAKAPLKF